jgi:hypothetical protein
VCDPDFSFREALLFLKKKRGMSNGEKKTPFVVKREVPFGSSLRSSSFLLSSFKKSGWRALPEMVNKPTSQPRNFNIFTKRIFVIAPTGDEPSGKRSQIINALLLSDIYITFLPVRNAKIYDCFPDKKEKDK